MSSLFELPIEPNRNLSKDIKLKHPHSKLLFNFIILNLFMLTACAATLKPEIIKKETWENRNIIGQKSKLTSHSQNINKITLHHTATPNTTPVNRRLRGIRRYHIKGKKWGDIAYHYLIAPNGKIYQGRNAKYIGSSSTHYNLDNNLLIALLGDFETEHPTEKALSSLVLLTASKLIEYKITPNDVHTHKQQVETLCPGRHLQRWFDKVGKKQLVKKYKRLK